MPEQPVAVDWELAEDERFSRIVRSGTAIADPAWAHSVHVEPGGLEPDRWYFYRFHIGLAVSPIGRTRTAPVPETRVDRVRLAFASCSQWEHGYYTAYQDMAERDLDLMIHVGDYIYENSWGELPPVRVHNTPGTVTDLAGFRDRYAQYKTDPALQAAHAAAPWLTVWDDHEVANDYTDDVSPVDPDPASFLRTRAAAYKAYYEHMPLPETARPQGASAQMFGRYRYGDMLDLLLLDDRQYRSHHVCIPPDKTSGWFDCQDRFDPTRTMLGRRQEQWLDDAFSTATARWTTVVQQTLMSECRLNTGGGDSYFMDGWDGYVAARNQLLDSIATHRPPNPVIIGGDVHCFCAADMKRDFRDASSPVLAAEFTGTSITSEGPPTPAVQAALAQNPHLRFADGRQRGYVSMDFGKAACTVDFHAVKDVRDPASSVSTLRRFTCEAGKSGVSM